MNMYTVIQQKTKYRRTAGILAVFVKVAMKGEGTKSGIENGTNLSFPKEKHDPLILANLTKVKRSEFLE